MTQTSFGFQSTGWTLAISLIAMVSVFVLSYIAWRRTGYRSSALVLELLRIGIVSFAVFLLNQPETVEEFKPTQKPTVVILGDQSLSMDTQDVGLGDSASSTPLLTRRRAIEPLMDTATWEAVTERLEVVITPFATEDSGARSNLHDALANARV